MEEGHAEEEPGQALLPTRVDANPATNKVQKYESRALLEGARNSGDRRLTTKRLEQDQRHATAVAKNHGAHDWTTQRRWHVQYALHQKRQQNADHLPVRTRKR